MSYSHLNISERCCIAQLRKEGISIREITMTLDRSPSTISREINRNKSKTGYYPNKAQSKYEYNRISCHRPTVYNEGSIDYITDKIKKHLSPEQITHRETEDDIDNRLIRKMFKFLFLSIK